MKVTLRFISNGQQVWRNSVDSGTAVLIDDSLYTAMSDFQYAE